MGLIWTNVARARLGVDRRASAQARVGRVRAVAVAARLGTALRDARASAGMTQAQAAYRAGVSQARISHLERGHGRGASIETWAMVAAAVGEQFVGFLERAPGASLPRDIEHLRRQSALIAIAAPGGWSALPEFRLDQDARWSRSIDVALVRRATGRGGRRRDLELVRGRGRERCAGSTARWRRCAITLDPSVEWTVRGPVHRARHAAKSEARGRARADVRGPVSGQRARLAQGADRSAQRLPDGDGLLWSDRTGTSLKASRLSGLKAARQARA